jgi:hypothetical protein
MARAGASAVDDAGRLARIAQTAARTRTLLGALKSDELHEDSPFEEHRDQCHPV